MLAQGHMLRRLCLELQEEEGLQLQMADARHMQSSVANSVEQANKVCPLPLRTLLVPATGCRLVFLFCVCA